MPFLAGYPGAKIARGAPTEIPFDFGLPDDLYCTNLSGQLVKVTYRLLVNLEVPWAIDLAIELPVRVIE